MGEVHRESRSGGEAGRVDVLSDTVDSATALRRGGDLRVSSRAALARTELGATLIAGESGSATLPGADVDVLRDMQSEPPGAAGSRAASRAPMLDDPDAGSSGADSGSMSRGDFLLDTDVSGANRTPFEIKPDLEERRVRAMILSKLFKTRAAPVKLGRFTVIKRLGEGGMGVVYAAYDDKLDRKVAVKVLRGTASGDDDPARVRLLREAQAMARLSHPNIVTVHEVGELADDGEHQVFMAMEFVAGQTLGDWLSEPSAPRAWREVVEVFIQAGRGLAAAHAAGLVHRDFKPGNVLVREDGCVKVLDFGLARARAAALPEPEGAQLQDEDAGAERASLLDVALTRTGAIMGTPAYMSPEQHMGRETSVQSDIFSFCVALYEALYHQHPYECDSLPKLVHGVLHGEVRELPSETPVPAWVGRVVLQGMQVEASDRPASIEQVLEALARDPARVRRQRVAATAALVLTAGFGYAAAGQTSAAPPVCEGADEELAAIWGPAQRAALGDALRATGLDYADETFARVEPLLTAYGESWAEMRTETCMTHQEGRQSAQLLDLRMACLDGRLAGFDALVSTLSDEPDASAIQKAAEAALSLAPLSYCADAGALTSAVPPPEDPETRAGVQAERERLARARTLESLGRYEAAATLAGEVGEEAKTLEYAPLAAEAALRRGSALMDSGDVRGSLAALSDAMYRAIAAGHAEVAAEAATKRLFVEAERVGDPKSALANERLVAALVERAPDDGRLRGLHLNNLAAAYAKLGESERGRELYDEALEVKRRYYGENHPEFAYTLANAAFTVSGRSEFDRAVQYHQQALEILETTLGPEHPHVGFQAYNLGLLELRYGRLTRARATLERARRAIATSLGEDAYAQHYPIRSLGELANERRDGAGALALFEQAMALLERNGASRSLDAAHVMHRMARALMSLGRVDEAQQLHERAYELRVELLQGDHEDIVNSLNERALLHLHRGEHERALELFGEGLDIRERDPARRMSQIGISRMFIGQTLLAMGRPEQARDALTQAITEIESTGDPSSRRLADASRSMGDVYRALERPEAARESYRRALEIYRGLREPGDPLLALIELELARVDLRFGTDDETRARARGDAEDALARARAGGPGYAREVGEAEAWLRALDTDG